MKLNCGPTASERNAAKTLWHRWFAWHPVRIADQRTCVWLEAIERKGQLHCGGCDCFWSWTYRPSQGKFDDR